MPNAETMHDIRNLLNVADEETIKEWAENWLTYVARQPNGPAILKEEIEIFGGN